jgi:hypothetical protein
MSGQLQLPLDVEVLFSLDMSCAQAVAWSHAGPLHLASTAQQMQVMPDTLTRSQVGSCSGSTISGAFFLPFLAFGGMVTVRFHFTTPMLLLTASNGYVVTKMYAIVVCAPCRRTQEQQCVVFVVPARVTRTSLKRSILQRIH